MKVRVIQKTEHDFIPQWFNEDGKFGGKWQDVHLRDDFVPEHWDTLDAAQRACYDFEEKHKKNNGEVVWETDIRSW